MTPTPKVTVYDLDNKPHKMSHLNARDMLQHNGWSMTPVDRAALAKAEAMDAQDEIDTSDVDVSGLEKELNGLSKGEMIALAMERFGVKIDGRKAEAEVIETLYDLSRKAAATEAAAADEKDAEPDADADAEPDED